MSYETPIPEKMPEAGFYYHYKHDPEGSVNNYAYYILGTGHHTEEDCREEDSFMMVYQPLYAAYVYKLGKLFDLRPVHMFFETATVGGMEVPRFTKISDPKVITELKEIRKRMYGEVES